MKNIKILLLTFVLLLLLGESVLASDSGYIVKFKDGFVPDKISLEKINPEIGLYLVENTDVLNGIEDKIEYVEENIEVEFLGDCNDVVLQTLPEDEYYPEQWQTQMINADYIWDFETYGNEINVAVIDTGCNPHEDIKDNLKGGYNYLKNVAEYKDNDGHGTHVAGIIAAAHNDIGIAGVAPCVNIYALKCVDAGYVTTLDMLARAIKDAVDLYNCKVINMSLGTAANYGALYDMVKYAYDNGTVIVASAGNINTNGIKLYYPAGYDEVIGVGSVDVYKEVSYFSLKNSSVFVTAPGEKVKSLKGTSEYTYKSGTSQAAPLVSGAAALMFSAFSDLTIEQLKGLIISCSEDLGDTGYDTSYGYGLINLSAMFNKMLSSVPYYVSPINDVGVLVYNNTVYPMQGVGIFAEYDENKHYIDSSITDIILMSGKKVKITTEFKENSKFFLWYSLDTAYPMADFRSN